MGACVCVPLYENVIHHDCACVPLYDNVFRLMHDCEKLVHEFEKAVKQNWRLIYNIKESSTALFRCATSENCFYYCS